MRSPEIQTWSTALQASCVAVCRYTDFLNWDLATLCDAPSVCVVSSRLTHRVSTISDDARSCQEADYLAVTYRVDALAMTMSAAGGLATSVAAVAQRAN